MGEGGVYGMDEIALWHDSMVRCVLMYRFYVRFSCSMPALDGYGKLSLQYFHFTLYVRIYTENYIPICDVEMGI